MTDQETPLKTKAISIVDIQELCFDSNHDNEKLVWLSDVEPLELEIQQLKTQIETAKQICIDSMDGAPTILSKILEVFGEKTKT